MIWSYQAKGGNDTQLKLYKRKFYLSLHHFHVPNHIAFLLENTEHNESVADKLS